MNLLIIVAGAILYVLAILFGNLKVNGRYITNPLIKIPVIIVFLPVFGFLMIAVGYVLVSPVFYLLGLDPIVLKFTF